MRHCHLVLFLLSLFPLIVAAQADISAWQPAAPARYAFVHYDENAIGQSSALDAVFKKLVALHATRKGKVSIVHIGDSHIQGDGITRVLRNGFRTYFGDAGRGLVFPYQLAGSNGPEDLSSSSNVPWRSNRLTNRNSPIATGICGYGIESERDNAMVHIRLKDKDGVQERFDRMVFFLGKEKAYYNLSDSGITTLPSQPVTAGTDNPSLVFETDRPITGFQLSRTVFDSGSAYQFYGVSLEHSAGDGVIYHTIGVNGARYDQYVEDALFWEQLSALDGDLFIVSMGTNEAQNPGIAEAAFMAVCDSFVNKIHRIAPRACVLITTPPGSYYKMKRPNATVQKVAQALVHFCQSKGDAYWDLDHICGSKASAAGWKKSGLMAHDLVHYTAAGYQLQGDLLINALAKAYNSYAITHPYKAPKPAPKTVRPGEMEKKQVPGKESRPTPQPAAPKYNGRINSDSIPPPHTKLLKVDYSG